MDLFLQFLLNGIVFGSGYILVALGLTLIFSIMQILNFAHGEIYMFGAYICWTVLYLITNNYWIALGASMVVIFFMGLVIERLSFRPLYEKPGINMFIISLALVIILQEVATLIWTGFAKRIDTPYKSVRRFGNLFITDERLIVIGVALLLIIAALLFFRFSKTGKAMRAAAQDRIGAGLVGIDINRTSALAFAVGSAMAAAAGCLLGPLFMLVPMMGQLVIMKSFVIIIIGGMGSIGGAIIGGYLLGIIESLFAGYAWSEWSPAVGFVFLVLVLTFRPKGLFGKA